MRAEGVRCDADERETRCGGPARRGWVGPARPEVRSRRWADSRAGDRASAAKRDPPPAIRCAGRSSADVERVLLVRELPLQQPGVDDAECFEATTRAGAARSSPRTDARPSPVVVTQKGVANFLPSMCHQNPGNDPIPHAHHRGGRPARTDFHPSNVPTLLSARLAVV